MKYKMRGKQGQMIILGIMILIMSVILFIAVLPAIKNVLDNSRGCDNLNCKGYKDRDADGTSASCTAGNRTYDSTIEEDTITCVIVDIVLPYLILGVLVALIAGLMYGKLVRKEEPQYPQFQQYG